MSYRTDIKKKQIHLNGSNFQNERTNFQRHSKGTSKL